jgi:hypothetical protein
MWNPYNNPHYAQYATVTVYYPNSCVNDITTTTTTSSSTSSTTTSSTTSTSSTTTTTTTTTTTFCPNCIEHDVIIGTQTWTGCNLNVDRYRNGDLIPQVTDPTAWAALTTGAWCSYNNDNTNEPFGLLSLSIDIMSIILTQFLTIYDIGNLDTAYCNKKKRIQLLNILSNNESIQYNHLIFNDSYKSIDNLLIWIGNRKIKILELSKSLNED